VSRDVVILAFYALGLACVAILANTAALHHARKSGSLAQY
jgi:hypothetical protein